MYPISLSISTLGKISHWAADYKDYLTNLDWAQVATVVIAGVFIVLAVLIVLIGIFKGFGSLLTATEKRAKKRAEKKAQKKAAEKSPASAPVAAPAVVKKPAPAPAPAVQQGISGEVVAAITAAITASEGGAPVSIRSIKVKNVSGRNPWASAAIMDNARPF